MNFAREALHYWILAERQEAIIVKAGQELKERNGGIITNHPVRADAIEMQQHYLRKSHAAAALAMMLGHTVDDLGSRFIGDIGIPQLEERT